MAAFASKPSNYTFLQKVRKSKKAVLKSCPYIKPDTNLRDYQSIGVIHFLSLSRMVLGDGVGLGKCVSDKTYIQTNKGIVKLSEFIPNSPKKDTLYEYEGSCKLLTKDGLQIPDVIYYHGESDGIKIRTQKGYELIGLPHHPIYIPKLFSFEYSRLDSLEIGNYVCIYRQGSFSVDYHTISYLRDSLYSKEYKIPEKLDEEFAELIGYYVSESGSHSAYGFVITQHDPFIHNRIRYLLEKIFGYVQAHNKVDYNKEIKVFSTEIYNVLKSLGVNLVDKSEGQRVPDSILQSPKSVVVSFLRAYFEGDGSVESSNKIVSCSSKSEILINQIQLLLLNFGIVARRKIKNVKVKDYRKPYHILYLCGKDCTLYQENIGFISDRKNEALLNINKLKRNTNKDIIPIGKYLIKTSVKDIINYLRTIESHKGFSIKGSGWKGIAGVHHKRMLEEVIYKKKQLTYELLDNFINIIESNNLHNVVSNFDILKDLQQRKIFFDKIVSIENEKAIFADFHVPSYHNFIGNGFINHNTLQTIAGYVYRLLNRKKLKLLVVTPKSAMEQWKEEFEKFCIGINVHILSNEYGISKDGTRYGFVEDLRAEKIKCKKIYNFQARKAQYDTIDSQVLIVNYKAVQNDYNFLVENRLPEYQVVFDEVQEIKNDKTRTWFGAYKISSKASFVYGLSATIIKNRLEEAYNIYNVIVPGIFPGRNTFLKTFTKRKKMKVWRKGRKRYFNKVVGYQNLNLFKEILDPYFLIRRTRDVASELPQLISRKLILEMCDKQSQLYKQALSGDLYRRLIKDKYFKYEELITSKNNPTEKELKILEKLSERYEESLTKDGLEKSKLAALSYCQLVSNGPGWLGEDGESSKETEFRRLFEQELSEEKTIIFTRFKIGLPRLSTILDNLGIKNLRITGDENSKQRTDARLKFQDLNQDYKVIFITAAGSAAINLQAAGVILYYDTPWSYGDLYQSIGRAQRIGSIREHILILHMINKKSIDEHVLEILNSKKDLIGEVIGDIAQGALEFDNDEIVFRDGESSIEALFNSVFKKVV